MKKDQQQLATVQEPTLFELEEDAGLFLLLPPDELKDRCRTAASLRKWERMRELVAMVMFVWPTDEIARRTGISPNTLRAFAASEGEKVARSLKDLQLILRTRATRWLALATTREHDAPFQHLVLASKLMMDAAGQLDQTGLVAEEKVITEHVDRVEAARRLRALMETVDVPSTSGGGASNDVPSSVMALTVNNLRECRAVGGAETGHPDEGDQGPAGEPEAGGGSGAPLAGTISMGSPARNFGAKDAVPSEGGAQ